MFIRLFYEIKSLKYEVSFKSINKRYLKQEAREEAYYEKNIP